LKSIVYQEQFTTPNNMKTQRIRMQVFQSWHYASGKSLYRTA